MKYTCKLLKINKVLSNKASLLKIGKVAGMHYSVGKSNTVVVYGIGAPIPPDNGNLPDAPVLLKFAVDIFVPDYIGYGRSDGAFTPKNCIKTFLFLYEAFKNGCIAKNAYESKELKLKYKRIIFIGRSFGGTYVPLLPRFNKEIKEIGLIYPVVDSKSQGSIEGEETNKIFLDSMRSDGYYHLYRGILSKKWEDHLENKDGLSPMDNINHLKDIKVFIGHGKQDQCVHYSKSVRYYKKVVETYPGRKKQFEVKLYLKGDHSEKTSNSAVKDFMKWLGFG